MNHLKHILFASALVASMSAAAQETYQDTKLQPANSRVPPAM